MSETPKETRATDVRKHKHKRSTLRERERCYDNALKREYMSRDTEARAFVRSSLSVVRYAHAD